MKAVTHLKYSSKAKAAVLIRILSLFIPDPDVNNVLVCAPDLEFPLDPDVNNALVCSPDSNETHPDPQPKTHVRIRNPAIKNGAATLAVQILFMAKSFQD